MGLFRKKKKAVIVKTVTQTLNQEIKKHNNLIGNYNRLVPRLNKFVAQYKHHLSAHAYINDDAITLHFTKDFTEYPDGFFALADKLGLNIEPICMNTYSYGSAEKSFIVRAKAK